MIPYVEILGKYSLSPFAVVEPSQCWFELSYYEIGEFEIYCRASESNLKALKNGNYVKLPNKPYLWVICIGMKVCLKPLARIIRDSAAFIIL